MYVKRHIIKSIRDKIKTIDADCVFNNHIIEFVVYNKKYYIETSLIYNDIIIIFGQVELIKTEKKEIKYHYSIKEFYVKSHEINISKLLKNLFDYIDNFKNIRPYILNKKINNVIRKIN